MRRGFLIALLTLTTVAGYAAGFAHMHHCGADRREAFEQHVADVCTEAALRTMRAQAPAAPK